MENPTSVHHKEIQGQTCTNRPQASYFSHPVTIHLHVNVIRIVT